MPQVLRCDGTVVVTVSDRPKRHPGFAPVGRWRGTPSGPFPAAPGPNPPCQFPGNGLSSDHHVGRVNDCVHAGHHVPVRRSALRLPSRLVMPGHLACFALCPAFPDPLAGRNSCDYYQASVAIGLASRRRSRVRPCCTYRAERRRPTHLLECPHWASPMPRRVRRQIRNTSAEHGTGFGRLASGCRLASSGDLASGNSALAIFRGSRSAPPLTPGHGPCFPGMLWSPSPFGSRSAIRPRNLPPSSSQLCWGYTRAPRGAAVLPKSGNGS